MLRFHGLLVVERSLGGSDVRAVGPEHLISNWARWRSTGHEDEPVCSSAHPWNGTWQGRLQRDRRCYRCWCAACIGLAFRGVQRTCGARTLMHTREHARLPLRAPKTMAMLPLLFAVGTGVGPLIPFPSLSAKRVICCVGRVYGHHNQCFCSSFLLVTRSIHRVTKSDVSTGPDC